MAQNDNSPPPPSEERRFKVQRIYTKDISFETPHSPEIFTVKRWIPDVDVQLGSAGGNVRNNLYEIILTVTVTTKVEEKTAYLVEIKQAGLFTIDGIGEDELAVLIGSYCPAILFPYAREAISNLVMRGGFPQLVLNPVNFEALYSQHLEETQEKGQPQEHTSTH